MRTARRGPGLWVGMVSLFAPTDWGRWEVRSREPSLWGLFLPPAAASWCVSGAAVPETRFRDRSSLPPFSASARRPRPPGSRLLRPRAPSRHLGVPGRKKHGSLPGTMHARTSTPPPAGAGSREPGSPTSGPPADTSAPQIQRRALLGQGPLTLFPSLYHCFGDSNPFNLLPVFSGIDYWQPQSHEVGTELIL